MCTPSPKKHTTYRKLLKTISSIVFIVACLKVGIPVHTAVDKDTIIGIWLFDEGISDSVKDASSNGHDGIVVGTPKVVNGIFGKALSFDGKERIEIPHHDRFTTSTFTLMAWVNIEDIRSGYQMIVGKNAHPYRNYAMYVHTDGKRLHCSFCAGRCMGNVNSHATIADGEWHHIAFTYDGTVERIYIDGEFDNERKVTAEPGTNTASVIISRPPFRGSIDEVFIGSVAISEDDVRRTFEDGIERFILTSVEPTSKLTAAWAAMKSSRN